MNEQAPGETIQEFLKRRSKLTPTQKVVYEARMTGERLSNEEIAKKIGLSAHAVEGHIGRIRKKGLPIRGPSRKRTSMLPAFPEPAMTEASRDVSAWAKQLGVWESQNGGGRPNVVKSPHAGVISSNEIKELWLSLFEGSGRASSSTKIRLAESVRLGIISPEDLSRQFSLHEETVLSWIERSWKDGRRNLYAKFDSNTGITPLGAKLLAAAHSQRAPIRIGEIIFDPASRTCSVEGLQMTLTTSESRLLLALSLFQNLFIDSETAYSFVYADVAVSERPDPNSLKVLLVRLENRLPSLQVQTIRGFGNRIIPGSAAKSPGSA